MKKIYDISLPVSKQTIVYPGDPPVMIRQISDVKKGDLTNISEFTFNTHTATHIDAPRHLFSNASGVDQIPLEVLIGPVTVYEFRNLHRIDFDQLKGLPLKAGDRVLFKTDNSYLGKEKFYSDYTCLSVSAAKYLAETGIKLIGIDYFSVDPITDMKEDHGTDILAVHRILLEKGIVILEGVNLSHIKPANYELICLPISLIDVDGAPVRAILRDL